MTPDVMARLSTLLDEALELDESSREAWLAALPDDAAQLGPTLRKLLARQGSKETADLLERGPSFTLPASGESETTAFHPGDTVGPYRLLRPLGHGGMGEVWQAERSDGTLKRKVALKLPHVTWAPGLAERFAREREILASLEHPNIARLYDAGLDPHGRPYMALEYVEGLPIDEFCKQRALPAEGRLRLLLQVADAVAFAHSRLVIHRDLKPGNILVTDDGQVRLLDFGIAKLMQGDVTGETALTRVGGRALTLDYASPEQIRGEPIGTPSDVYSLGVVAFELLAGERPYRLKRGSAAELEEAITGQDLPLASALVQGAELKKALRGDVDAILNKALKKSVTERYPTVDALAQDWRGHLAGQRVHARPDTFVYRILRFARRRRIPLLAVTAAVVVLGLALGFGATAVVIAALLIGLGVALWQARRALAERDRAFALADRNAAVNIFLDTLLTRAARAGPLSADQLLDRSERLIDSEIASNAEHRAYVLGVLANCHTQLDNPARAKQLLERAIEASRNVADVALRDSLTSRHALARGHLGEMNDAIATIDAILAQRNATPEVRSEAHSHRSVLASWNGDTANALLHAGEALRWFRASRLLQPRQEAPLLGNLGWAQLMRGQADEADRNLTEGMAVYERLGLADSPAAVQLIATAALAQQEMGDLPRSLELFDRGLAISARATPDTLPSVYLLANRAYTLTRMGRYVDAEAGYRMGADVARQQGAALIVDSIRMCIVELCLEQGNADDAEKEIRAADSERTVDVPDSGPANFARQLAEARLALLKGDAEAAISAYSKTIEGNEYASAGTVDALLGRAGALLQAGRIEAAGADARMALEFALCLQGRKPASFRTGLAQLMIARIQSEQRDVATARKAARIAVEQLSSTVDGAHGALILARRMSIP